MSIHCLHTFEFLFKNEYGCLTCVSNCLNEGKYAKNCKNLGKFYKNITGGFG